MSDTVQHWYGDLWLDERLTTIYHIRSGKVVELSPSFWKWWGYSPTSPIFCAALDHALGIWESKLKGHTGLSLIQLYIINLTVRSSVSKKFQKVPKSGTGTPQAWRATLEQPNNMHIAGGLLRFLGSTGFWSYSLLSHFLLLAQHCRHGTIQTMGHQGSPEDLQYLGSGWEYNHETNCTR